MARRARDALEAVSRSQPGSDSSRACCSSSYANAQIPSTNGHGIGVGLGWETAGDSDGDGVGSGFESPEQAAATRETAARRIAILT